MFSVIQKTEPNLLQEARANQKLNLKKALDMDDFLKLLSWRSQEIQQADAIPKTS